MARLASLACRRNDCTEGVELLWPQPMALATGLNHWRIVSDSTLFEGEDIIIDNVIFGTTTGGSQQPEKNGGNLRTLRCQWIVAHVDSGPHG